MAVYIPVVRKYKVGDHVGLEIIRAVGMVMDRRGVYAGFVSDEGQGTYLVKFLGVPKSVHEELGRVFCRCQAHSKLLQRMASRKMRKATLDAVRALATEAERNCEGSWVESEGGLGESTIWYESTVLLNCSGKERLPLNVNITYGTPPPYFPQTPAGTWDPSEAPRYAHGTHLG